jgi:hypothetical protein
MSHISVDYTTDKFQPMLTFYDAILTEVGAKRQMLVIKTGEHLDDVHTPYREDIVAVAYGKYWPEFWIQLPENKKEATVGNGCHFVFACSSEDQCKRVYETALAHGGVSNGEPGLRPKYTSKYYGAFFLDPMGNKLEAIFYDMGTMNYCEIL